MIQIKFSRELNLICTRNHHSCIKLFSNDHPNNISNVENSFRPTLKNGVRLAVDLSDCHLLNFLIVRSYLQSVHAHPKHNFGTSC